MMYHIIKEPLTTEKNTQHQAQNIYVFKVAKTATKQQIVKAVEQLFEVKVIDIRTLISRKRQHKGRGRRTGKNVNKIHYWKKAFVKLSPNSKIRIFEGV